MQPQPPGGQAIFLRCRKARGAADPNGLAEKKNITGLPVVVETDGLENGNNQCLRQFQNREGFQFSWKTGIGTLPFLFRPGRSILGMIPF